MGSDLFGVISAPTTIALTPFQLSDVRIHYVEEGDKSKPLLLFVHGFPEFWYSWRFQIKHFAKTHQ